jgi:hypothetical protein
MHKISCVSLNPLTKYQRRGAIKCGVQKKVSFWKFSIALPPVNILNDEEVTRTLRAIGAMQQTTMKQISTVKCPVQSMNADNGSLHEARVGQHFIKGYNRGCPSSEAQQLRWCQGRSCHEIAGVALTGNKDIRIRKKAGVVIFWWLDTFNANLCFSPDATFCQVLLVNHAARCSK